MLCKGKMSVSTLKCVWHNECIELIRRCVRESGNSKEVKFSILMMHNQKGGNRKLQILE